MVWIEKLLGLATVLKILCIIISKESQFKCQLLMCEIHVAGRKDVARCEELILNAVATINNLSYYSVDRSSVSQHRLRIAECMF